MAKIRGDEEEKAHAKAKTLLPVHNKGEVRVPTEEEIAQRKIVGVTLETVENVSSTDYPGHWPLESNHWDLSQFTKYLKVEFHSHTALQCSFSLIGVDASIANAFRRIMIAEIPSLAIEQVFVNNNTSIIQDEVLAQRLGLVPFKGGKQGLREFLKWMPKPDIEAGEEYGGESYDNNTISLSLKVECTRNETADKGEKDPLKAYHNAHVYASDIKFRPFGRQEQFFSGENAIVPTNPDILIAKMRPGQVLDIDMHAVKGIGSDHAKFSPVATTSYRLMPTINIVKPILGDDARKFQKCFPAGVIGLEKVTKEESKRVAVQPKRLPGVKDKDVIIATTGYEGREGEIKAVVKNPMNDTVSREALRHPEFEGKVKLGRVRDHFIFSVESVGQWDSDELFLESVRLLRLKCYAMKASVNDMTIVK